MDAVLRTRPPVLGAAAALVLAVLIALLILTDSLTAADAVARSGALLGLTLLAGLPWLTGLLLGGALSSEEARIVRRRAEQLASAGGILVVATGLLGLWLLAERSEDGVADVIGSRAGVGQLLRVAIALVLAVGYATGIARRRSIETRTAGLLAASTLGLGAHAATEDYALIGILVAGTHALAAVAFGGAIGALMLALALERRDRARSDLLRTVLPRLAVAIATSAAALASTGLFSAWAHTGAVADTGSPYGLGVMAKTILLVAGLGAGWVTLARAGRAAPRETADTLATAHRALAIGAGGVVLALVVSGTLAAIDTPRDQRQAEERAAGIVTESTDAGITIRSRIAPGSVGPNTLRVDLLEGAEPYEDATAVGLRYANLEANLSGTTVPLTQVGPAAWELTEPAILAVDGVYEFTVHVEGSEVSATQDRQFETGADRSTSRLDPTTAWWVGIFALAGVGAAMIAANALASRRRILRGEALGWIGAAVVAGALLLWGRGPRTAAFITNPIPATASSLAEGADVYVAHCARCHGVEFDGAGADAVGLPVQPANLVLHFPQHADGQHFTVISNGRAQSGMPAWDGALTDEEIWNVINYLRIETEKRAPTLQVP